MSEDDIDALGPDGQGSAAAARVDRDRRAPRFSWTPAYETTFFRSLCESVHLGLRENSSFKAEAWERAAQALQQSHAALPTKSHLINKSDNARKRFRLWRGLREDPDFAYNPETRTVTATEDAWRAHIEREPLSRALRGRPFDHEDFMEVLYPDVIGSGGAPKRVMKPRRRTDGQIEDPDMPGTSILNLHDQSGAPASLPNSPELQLQRPTLSQTPTSSSTSSLPQHPARPRPTVVQAKQLSNPTMLTPPDETPPSAPTQANKRPLVGATPVHSFDSGVSLATSVTSSGVDGAPEKRRRLSANPSMPSSTESVPLTTYSGTSASIPVPRPSHLPPTTTTTTTLEPHPAESLLLGLRPVLEEMVEAIKSRAAPTWREDALDLFFRDFADEDPDLQVNIANNVLSDEGKAMVFCKMPAPVRRHWLRRYRELHYR